VGRFDALVREVECPQPVARPTPHPFDCSRRAAALFWVSAGFVLTLAMLHTFSGGRWAWLLSVGSSNPLLEQIELELGPVGSRDRLGHDGQLVYMIARDPLGRGPAPAAIALIDNNGPAYRYRRILLSWLAGGFGTFSPRTTVALIVLLTALGIGLSTVAVADLGWMWGARPRVAILAMANAGALISAFLLTVDALALGLALLGIALTVRNRLVAACLAFACASMTKETYALVPVGIAGWLLASRRWSAAAVIASAIAPTALWTMWVTRRFHGAVNGDGNVGWPGVGFFTAAERWTITGLNPGETFFAAFGASLLVLGVAACVRRRPLRQPGALALVLPWLGLALCSTYLVWGHPHNAGRAFSLLWPVTWLLLSRPDPARGAGAPVLPGHRIGVK
jgi:hypothetical protein